jgi:hypothetical protein
MNEYEIKKMLCVMRVFLAINGRQSPLRQRRRGRGFALVVTLSLMMILIVVAVGLLTLSSISLRGSSHSLDHARARANARIALTLAIGELQKHAGADTRVTARADVLNEIHPPVLGVWKSWEGTDHELLDPYAGRPKSPGDYAAAKKSRFLAWLTSVPSTADTPPDTAESPPGTPPSLRKPTLVGAGSVGGEAARSKLQVHLTRTLMGTSKDKGAFAWWVGGENQKARLPKPYSPTNDTVSGWAVHAKSHPVADPSVFRMDTVFDDAALAPKSVSLRQADVFTAKKDGLTVSSEFFHDLSAVSTGLLTNTATGGWRKDLSLLTENWSMLSTTGQPFFRVEPGSDLLYNLPVSGGDYRPTRSLFYPWSGYRGSTSSTGAIYEHGAVSSWENLKDWATLYKSMPSNATTTSLPNSPPRSFRITSADPVDKFNFLHRARVIPVIARIQWVFSHWAAETSPGSGTFDPRLLATPVITLWNPYNVTLTSSSRIIIFISGMPNLFRFNVGGVQNNNWNSLINSNYVALCPVPSLQYEINSEYTFRPGETMLFSPSGLPRLPNAPGRMRMTPGYRNTGGHYFELQNDAGTKIAGLAGATIIKAAAKFDASSGINDVGVVRTSLDMQLLSSTVLATHQAYRMTYDSTVAAEIYPPISNLASVSLTELTELADGSEMKVNPKPFLYTIFGARSASRTYLAAKGFVQSSPLVNYTAMGSSEAGTIKWDYPGTAHPVNAPFDFSYQAIASPDSLLPNTDSANHGFIVTGFQSADGLSRCTIAELPTKPLQSLAELQNWNLRYENPIPPYSFNTIGNSDATPLIPPDAVFNSGNAATGQLDLQHDDSYCANHLLFDDWFVSSIAPKTAKFGQPAATETLQKTFTDFVSDKDPLPNRAYRPIPGDVATAQTTSGADSLFNTQANTKDSWQVIASRIEVEGMFNVNSTSVSAWRALLGNARNQKVPYTTASGSALSAQQDHAFSRFSVAGDTEAKTPGSSGQFKTCAEFSGYRILDGPVLDRFAEEIVKQVRARGPFLSLSEFVNRQLSSGNLALAGTIQAALNALEKDLSINPYSVIQSGSNPSSSTPPSSANTGYKFPAAAEGYNAYGLPGWTRQADVLRPIAPILSARDDTFVIRAYGDARDPSGETITARATCEAVVRRVRDYVDPADAPDITTLPKSATNRIFGRRFEIVSFRWLADGEI